MKYNELKVRQRRRFLCLKRKIINCPKMKSSLLDIVQCMKTLYNPYLRNEYTMVIWMVLVIPNYKRNIATAMVLYQFITFSAFLEYVIKLVNNSNDLCAIKHVKISFSMLVFINSIKLGRWKAQRQIVIFIAVYTIPASAASIALCSLFFSVSPLSMALRQVSWSNITVE